MLRSHWCIGFAALLAATPLPAQQASNADSGQPGTNNDAKVANNTPSPIAPAIDRVANELAETRKDQADPYGDQRNEREKRDLIAQEDSAYLAGWNFIAMITQTLLAGGALFALLCDLRQNRKSAEAQLRAYLVFDEFIWNTARQDYKMQIKWVNVGQTPASAVAYADWVALPNPLPDDFCFPRPSLDKEEGPASIGPNRKIFGTSAKDLTQLMVAKVVAGQLHVYVWGRADYVDAFGKKRFTNTASKLRVETLPENGWVIRWVALNRHNDAD
jgi:hypothetical protein